MDLAARPEGPMGGAEDTPLRRGRETQVDPTSLSQGTRGKSSPRGSISSIAAGAIRYGLSVISLMHRHPVSERRACGVVGSTTRRIGMRRSRRI